MSFIDVIRLTQVIASAEESLKDFEQRITELKTRGAALQADQISTNKLLKLQVTCLIDGFHTVHLTFVVAWFSVLLLNVHKGDFD